MKKFFCRNVKILHKKTADHYLRLIKDTLFMISIAIIFEHEFKFDWVIQNFNYPK